MAFALLALLFACAAALPCPSRMLNSADYIRFPAPHTTRRLACATRSAVHGLNIFGLSKGSSGAPSAAVVANAANISDFTVVNLESASRDVWDCVVDDSTGFLYVAFQSETTPASVINRYTLPSLSFSASLSLTNDYGLAPIRVALDIVGQFLYVLANTAILKANLRSFVLDDQLILPAGEYWYGTGLALDPTRDILYVSDQYGVRRLSATPSLQFLTPIVTRSISYSPESITLDTTGDLLYIQSSDQTVDELVLNHGNEAAPGTIRRVYSSDSYMSGELVINNLILKLFVSYYGNTAMLDLTMPAANSSLTPFQSSSTTLTCIDQVSGQYSMSSSQPFMTVPDRYELFSDAQFSTPPNSYGIHRLTFSALICAPSLVNNSDCAKCWPGTYHTGGLQCQPCPPGTYNDVIGQIACTPCPTGRANNITGATSLSQCELCAPGSAQNGTGKRSCIGCSPGTVAPNFGQQQCTECPLNTYNADSSASSILQCRSCPLGAVTTQTGATRLSDCVCPARTVSLNSQCVCAPGFGYQTSTGACEPCYGSSGYKPFAGNAACTPCPQQNTASRGNTTSPATSLSDCVCAPGFFSAPVTTQDSDYCIPCYAGAECPGDGHVYPRTGYWVGSANFTRLYECPTKSACPGYPDVTNLQRTACALGYQGRLCAQCADKYGKAPNGDCVSCAGTNPIVFVVCAVVVFALVCAVYYLQNGRLSVGRAAQFGILINFLQAAAQSPATKVTFIGGVFELNLTNLTPGECVSPSSYTLLWFLQLLTPLFFLSGVLVLYLVLYAASRITGKSMDPEVGMRCRSTAVVLLLYLYLADTKTAFEAFVCTEIEGVNVWTSSPDVLCYEGIHVALVVAAIVAILLLCIIFPVVLFHKLSKPSPLRDLLTQAYNPDMWWWEIVLLARRVMVALLAQAFLNSGIVYQMFALLILFQLLALAHTLLRPYKQMEDNGVEAFALGLVSVIFSIELVSQTGSGTGSVVAVLTILFVFSGAVMIKLTQQFARQHLPAVRKSLTQLSAI